MNQSYSPGHPFSSDEVYQNAPAEPSPQPSPPHRRRSRSSWAMELGRAGIAAVVGISATIWTARGFVEEFRQHSQIQDARLDRADDAIKEIRANMVPRVEHQARWDSIDRQLAGIQGDLRDSRNEIHELLIQQRGK